MLPIHLFTHVGCYVVAAIDRGDTCTVDEMRSWIVDGDLLDKLAELAGHTTIGFDPLDEETVLDALRSRVGVEGRHRDGFTLLLDELLNAIQQTVSIEEGIPPREPPSF